MNTNIIPERRYTLSDIVSMNIHGYENYTKAYYMATHSSATVKTTKGRVEGIAITSYCPPWKKSKEFFAYGHAITEYIQNLNTLLQTYNPKKDEQAG